MKVGAIKIKGSAAEWLAELLDVKATDLLAIGVQIALLIVAGLLLGRLLSGTAARLAARRGSAQGVMITRRFVFYAILVLTVLAVLDTLGVSPSVLLGAAGILSVALGFASQTSASNVISGVFLLGERPFSVGDAIVVGETTGEVLSVDLLSVKLRTFDNLYVRVPNETLIKSEIVNLSRNPIRRIDIDLRVAYDEDLDRVRALLRRIALEEPALLQEPEPIIWVDRLGDSAIHVRFLVWASNRGGFFDTRSRVMEMIARAFAKEGVAVGYQKVRVDEPGGTGAAVGSLQGPDGGP
ncbi:mechanosensitive ion channel family protein [Pseudenhygromyxa sp. WMMC2535]|uniref:mechanosensitive ion channel family protein n=1 Tax=Pseudenhygromyxa sp. WMMC2535 TaxID=2712867 RepID=UPI0015526451|nr:mechanosensitive ion channel family protein [Pseudenhygromyxa sp. WMMC2535]NVB39953.1 mechanosensitive ion channel family protein [Pseudenhygromyxa sp. WMMC2535]